ncbi:hypothetical protein AVEN_222069-1 [Araneus ventricosus]|uniref:Uncharacterized protein n=1 Tax=Araneus ventricosus TaxID=182803 RepID=A0A4Y2V0D9_ARAVE|nr:hypothetical protein AVEN_222069-1 [Araneus ventricosus]
MDMKSIREPKITQNRNQYVAPSMEGIKEHFLDYNRSLGAVWANIRRESDWHGKTCISQKKTWQAHSGNQHMFSEPGQWPCFVSYRNGCVGLGLLSIPAATVLF